MKVHSATEAQAPRLRPTPIGRRWDDRWPTAWAAISTDTSVGIFLPRQRPVFGLVAFWNDEGEEFVGENA